MDVRLSCGLCGFEVSADSADTADAEHLTHLYTAVHTAHTDKQVSEFMWANGNNENMPGPYGDGEQDA